MNITSHPDHLILRALLSINIMMLILHMYINNADLVYFCQLTIIGQLLVILNFYLSILFHEQKRKLQTQLFLSRFHLITLALEAIVVVGFWGLRVFFPIGIIGQGERSFIVELASLYLHGGSFATMFYFVKRDQILTQTKQTKKVFFHLLWALPFMVIQYLRWHFTGEHIYGFIQHFTWMQLVVFQLSLFFIAVYCDYFISVKHGFKLLKNLQQSGSRTHISIKPQ